MKIRQIASVASAAALSLACTTFSWAESPLSIDQAVNLALKHNASVLAAHSEVSAARAAIGVAKSAQYPDLMGQSVYTHITDVPSFSFGGQTIALAAEDEVLSTVTLRQSIYTGGRISGGISQAEALYDLSVGNLGTTQIQVALQVRQAYFAVLLNQALVQSASDTLAAAERQLTDAQSRYEAGTSPKYDVLRAQTQVSQAQQTLLQAQNNVEISSIALNRVLGMALEVRYTLSDTTRIPDNSVGVEEMVKSAEKQRPEVLAARAYLAAAEQGIKIARSGGYPQLGVSLSYQDVTKPTTSLIPGYTLMASVSEEIFDGGRVRSSVRQAKASRELASIQLEDTIRMVEQDTRQAYLNLQTATKTQETAKATLAQAQEAYEVAVVRYEAGVGTATETADALAALTGAKTNLDNAKYGVSTAYATLQRTLGRTTY